MRNHVLREDIIAARRIDDVGLIAGDDQQAPPIIAAAAPDRIDEQLIDPRQRLIGLLLRPDAGEIRLLVQALEDQQVATVGEMGGDLAPVGYELAFRLGAEGRVGLRKSLLVPGIDPPAIPVDV